MNIISLWDINYLSKGLALYESLCNSIDGGFRFSVLCIDDETMKWFNDNIYNIQGKRNGIIVYESLTDMEKSEQHGAELKSMRELPATLYGDQRSNYLWILAPWWIRHNLSLVKEGESVLYSDSDLMWYKSPQFIINELGDKHVSVHTHRFSCSFDEYINNPKQITGWFNVGAVLIRNTPEGLAVADRWKHLCNTNIDPFHARWGACGDQSWLTQVYIELKQHFHVFDDTLAHLAPWTEFPEQFKSNDMCVFKGKEQPILFTHFSHFQYDLSNGTWKDNDHGEWLPSARSEVRDYYQRYFELICECHTKYKIV